MAVTGCAPLIRPPMFPSGTAAPQTSANGTDFPNGTGLAGNDGASSSVNREKPGSCEAEYSSGKDGKGPAAHAQDSPAEARFEYMQATSVGRDICKTKEKIRDQELNWRNAAEAYGNTSQLSKRLRDGLAIAGVATSLKGVGKTSVYYGLAAVVADRFPELVGSERQQAIFLLSADAASCMSAAIERMRPSPTAITRHVNLLTAAKHSKQEFLASTSKLIESIRRDKNHCVYTYGEPIVANDAGDHLRNITRRHRRGSSSCGVAPEAIFSDSSEWIRNADRTMGNYALLIAQLSEHNTWFARQIDKATYALNLELARGDASNLSSIQLAQSLSTMVNGTAQSGGSPSQDFKLRNSEYLDYMLARQKLMGAVEDLVAANTQLKEQMGAARKEAEACTDLHPSLESKKLSPG